jgi:PhnB protein
MAETTSPGGVAPYLTIDGAGHAILFYKTVFSAEELGRHLTGDGRRIMHCALRINGGLLMLADSLPGHDDYPPPGTERGSPVSISLALRERAEVDRLHRRAIDNGATTLIEPMDALWGARFAMFTDPFGHRWMLNAETGPPG